MLYGTVEYGLKDGGSDGKDWAGRALLVKRGEEDSNGWRMRFYQVYLVSCRFSFRNEGFDGVEADSGGIHRILL